MPISAFFCAAADPADACIWSHRGLRSQPSLLIRVLSRHGSAHGNSHIPRNGHQSNSAWHRPWCQLRCRLPTDLLLFTSGGGRYGLGHSTAGRRTRAENLERLAGDFGRWRIQTSKPSHLKIAWADTGSASAGQLSATEIAGPSIQAMHRSEDLSFLLQCDLRIRQLAAQRSLRMQLHMHSYLQLLGPAFSWLSAPAAFLCRDLGSVTWTEVTVFPGYNQHPGSGTPGVQPKVGPPAAIQSPSRDGNPQRKPQPHFQRHLSHPSASHVPTYPSRLG